MKNLHYLNHNYIHAFLYFTYNEHNRTLEEKEIELIRHIKNKLEEYGQDSIILFIINHIEKQNIYKTHYYQHLKKVLVKNLKMKII